MIVKPKFYEYFKCVADKCTDTCCRGWEIDVDEDTACLYDSMEGEVGQFVRRRLIREDGVKLCREGEKCRFLREDNLCELIIRAGEEYLCDICREHPRFYSESENVCEIGVGLCCPEAARMWLEEDCQFTFEEDGYLPDGVESDALERQFEVISFVLHGEGALGERLAALLLDDDKDAELYAKLCKLYASLEALDLHFSDCFSSVAPKSTDKRFERLAAYFIYRYYLLLGERLCLKFCAASLIMIAAMGEDIETRAKDYSKEVEYDPDNLERIYEMLSSTQSLGTLCREVFI